jgi:hypothetical protein
LAGFQGAQQVFQHLPGTDLAQEIGEAFFRDGCDLPGSFATGRGRTIPQNVRSRLEDSEEAFIAAALGGLPSQYCGGKQARGRFTAVDR